MHWKMEDCFNKRCWELWIGFGGRKELVLYFSPHTNLNSNWIKCLHVGPELDWTCSQTGTHVECPNCRQWLYPLCHNVSHFWYFWFLSNCFSCGFFFYCCVLVIFRHDKVWLFSCPLFCIFYEWIIQYIYSFHDGYDNTFTSSVSFPLGFLEGLVWCQWIPALCLSWKTLSPSVLKDSFAGHSILHSRSWLYHSISFWPVKFLGRYLLLV